MTIIIRSPYQTFAQIQDTDNLRETTKRWRSYVESRDQWIGHGDVRRKLIELAKKDITAFGIRGDEIDQLAKSAVVEVSFSKASGEAGWDLPWEHLLTTATSDERDGSMLVVRHLDGYRDPPDEPSAMESAIVIEAAPGQALDFYDFSTEERRMKASLRLHDDNKPLVNPTLHQLDGFQCDVIHLTGIAAKDALQLLGLKKAKDGNIFLAGKDGGCSEHKPDTVAKKLAAHQPQFVGCNLWHTGYTLAPMLVQNGVDASIGIEPTLDPFAAELFFFAFYNAAGVNVGNPELAKMIHVIAFQEAWKKVEAHLDLFRGTSVVLWSIKSVYGNYPRGITTKSREMESASKSKIEVPIKEFVNVQIRPVEQINYSLLHNGRSLFKKFWVTFKSIQDKAQLAKYGIASEYGFEFRNVKLHVELNVGGESFPYKKSFSIGDENSKVDFSRGGDAIHLSLMSQAVRAVQEPTQTNLFVELVWEDQTLYQNTFRVRLNPLDAWRLDDQDIWWLPSFVHPRDPAVAEIMKSAQSRLECLLDDSTAGFSGYQSAEGNPEVVDQQVKAIWHAIVSDFRPKYINPPPSFSDVTQRLRTPSDVIREKHGTCVDLAILFAACLEWIDIYPVIFLLEGHAFPGYWQSESAYEQFMDPEKLLADSKEESVLRDSPWVFKGPAALQRILPFLYESSDEEYEYGMRLTPLETVNLTKPLGFESSWREDFGGLGNFGDDCTGPWEFHSMIDIRGARQHGVTSLPIVELV